MTRDQFIQQAYMAAVGKATPPAPGTNKHSVLLGMGNIFIEQWQNEPNVDWRSLWRKEQLATVSATDRFAIDTDEVRKLSTHEDDNVVVESPEGKRAEFVIVRPEQLSHHVNAVALIGEYLVFSQPFASDSEFIGGKITVPYYTYAEKLVNANDEVPVDQPIWLVYMTAGEFVRNNDYIKQNQYSNLINLANEVMKSMKQNNKASQVTTAKRAWMPLAGETW